MTSSERTVGNYLENLHQVDTFLRPVACACATPPAPLLTGPGCWVDSDALSDDQLPSPVLAMQTAVWAVAISGRAICQAGWLQAMDG
jgi:hypothetical protein